jgi:hypothetical protein
MPDLAALLRSRSADVIGNVEMGPLLGRGAFGRVYKGEDMAGVEIHLDASLRIVGLGFGLPLGTLLGGAG